MKVWLPSTLVNFHPAKETLLEPEFLMPTISPAKSLLTILTDVVVVLGVLGVLGVTIFPDTVRVLPFVVDWIVPFGVLTIFEFTFFRRCTTAEAGWPYELPSP